LARTQEAEARQRAERARADEMEAKQHADIDKRPIRNTTPPIIIRGGHRTNRPD
jgi:hypothetical protein